jgi:hypothetical protein
MANRTKRSSRSRRRPSGHRSLAQILVPLGILVAIVAAALLVLRPVVPPAGPVAATPAPPPCPKVAPVIVGNISVPSGPIAGYCQEQLINAAQIMRAAGTFTTIPRAAQIGVMTAIGESSLRNLTYGDTAGPDSRGLFQQRSNWGPLADRMDPYTSAVLFYQRMINVPGWSTIAPTVVAHAVQRNANPDYYAPFFSRAEKVVAALTADTLPPEPTAIPDPTTPVP